MLARPRFKHPAMPKANKTKQNKNGKHAIAIVEIGIWGMAWASLVGLPKDGIKDGWSSCGKKRERILQAEGQAFIEGNPLEILMKFARMNKGLRVCKSA